MNLTGLRSPRAILALVGGAIVWISGGVWLLASEVKSEKTPEPPAKPMATSVKSAPTVLPVKPAGVAQPKVLTDQLDHRGNPVMAACSTCHTTREANYLAGPEALPQEFHQGLEYAHGALNCLSCHNADNYDTLRRADGRALAYDNVMALCSQCHGPQTRDYNHGSHGGMVGHWDLTKGDRQRNRCIDCHDVHAPAFPQVNPVFPPRDRGALEQLLRDQAHAESDPSPHHD